MDFRWQTLHDPASVVFVCFSEHLCYANYVTPTMAMHALEESKHGTSLINHSCISNVIGIIG